MDGKTLRGSRQSDGTGALHLVSTYATAAGLVLGQRAVDGKSNEITVIPELLDRLDIKGAIVAIDAMGTQKAIAAGVIEKGADYVLALKGNQASLHDDAGLFFRDPACAATFACEMRANDLRARTTCTCESETAAAHGRIEMAGSRSASAASPTPAGWPNVIRRGETCARAAITARRIDKKSGAESLETRVYIISLDPDPKAILEAARALRRRKQSPLDDGRDLRRRPDQNPKGRVALEPRHYPSRRFQHPQHR